MEIEFSKLFTAYIKVYFNVGIISNHRGCTPLNRVKISEFSEYSIGVKSSISLIDKSIFA